jgi:hypothetical protein
MSNWRILLGGVASVSVLAVGVAAPTLARPVSRAGDRPTSALTAVVPTGIGRQHASRPVRGDQRHPRPVRPRSGYRRHEWDFGRQVGAGSVADSLAGVSAVTGAQLGSHQA